MTEDRNAQPASGFGKLMHGVTQFGVIVAMVLLLKTVAAEAYFVPSGSMLPSLLVGDYLLVSKFPYGYSRYSLPVPLAPASSERLLGSCRSAATSSCSACRAIRARPTSNG